MNKNYFEVLSLKENDNDIYWKTKSYIERLQCIETMRKHMFNYDNISERLQRIYTIAPLKKD